jgi:hypothetical protein
MFCSISEHSLNRKLIDSRGFIKINNSVNFGLDEPYSIKPDFSQDEPVYIVSVFHQLHYLISIFPKLKAEIEKICTTTGIIR